MADRWIWTLDDDASDLVGPTPNLGNKRLLRYAENSGSMLLAVPFGINIGLWFWSPANQPGQSEWPVGPFDVQLWVLVANANITVQFTSLYRYDGLGNPIEFYTLGGSVQSCGTTGAKRWQGTTFAPTVQPTAGDRLRLGFVFFRNNSKGSDQVTIGFGDPARDYVKVPIIMGNPQIVWNGNTLAFPHPLTDYDKKLRSDREKYFSGGGVHAAQLHHQFFQVMAELGRFEDKTFKSDLVAWWSWAARGKQYAFALDAADVVDLTLNGAAAAGQKDIPLADTSSVVVGREYLLREAAGEEMEIIKVASITTNVKAVAEVNLKYGYLTGDVFRSPDYFPKMVSLDDDLPLREHVTNYSWEHSMREDKG